MPKIKTMDRKACKMLQEEMEMACQTVANKYGVSITHGNGSYGGNSMSCKMNISIISDNGTVMSKEAEDFNLHAHLFELKPEWLHKTFKRFSGETIKIIGLSPRSRKYPVLGKKASGKVFKFSAAEVMACMERM